MLWFFPLPIIARGLGRLQANFVSLEPCEGPGGGESAEALQAPHQRVDWDQRMARCEGFTSCAP
jgi:hypothetical protein